MNTPGLSRKPLVTVRQRLQELEALAILSREPQLEKYLDSRFQREIVSVRIDIADLQLSLLEDEEVQNLDTGINEEKTVINRSVLKKTEETLQNALERQQEAAAGDAGNLFGALNGPQLSASTIGRLRIRQPERVNQVCHRIGIKFLELAIEELPIT